MTPADVSTFVALQRRKRAERGQREKITSAAAYSLVDGILATRGGGRCD